MQKQLMNCINLHNNNEVQPKETKLEIYNQDYSFISFDENLMTIPDTSFANRRDYFISNQMKNKTSKEQCKVNDH